MKLRTALMAGAVIVLAAICVRLGFWQLSRLAQKRAWNAAQREALAAPPIDLGLDRSAGLATVRHHRVRARGHYDETHQVLLAGRSHGGSPGVHVVTPLIVEGGSAVLVDRGWTFADDAATARPQKNTEPGELTVIGIADSIPTTAPEPWRTIESDTVKLWSARRLALDSLRSRFPYALAPFLVRQLPGSGVPARPVREAPAPLNESVHVSYAVQWFLFALILLAGPPIVATSRRRAARPGSPSSDLEIPKR